jgi:nitrate reductase (NAD(P)H)
MIAAGADCTEEFDAIHSEKAQKMLSDYLIGELPAGSATTSEHDTSSTTFSAPSSSSGSSASTSNAASSPRSIATTIEEEIPFLNQRQWKKITLESKKTLSSSIRSFRFAFDTSMVFGLPVGKHVYLKLPQEKMYQGMPVKSVMRAYTPSDSGPGFVEFIVKIYYPENGSNPGGVFTQLLDKVRIGETVDTKGPLGEYEYLGDCQYAILHEPRRVARHIGMIAGGTGITPMWQILHALQYDRELPCVSLIYCARYLGDLVLAKEINEIQARFPDRLRVRYILSKPPPTDEWDGGRGRLTAEEISQNLFPFADSQTEDSDKVVLLCASDDMIAKCCKPLISDILGNEFASSNVFVF